MLSNLPEGSALSLASLRLLFDSVPGTFFFAKDQESRFIEGGDRFAEMMGAPTVEALLGKTDYDFCPDFLADAFYEDDQRVMTEGEPMVNKMELVPAKDGSLDWLCTTKVPFRSVSGEIVGLVGVARIIRENDALYAGHPEMRRIIDFVRSHYRHKLSVAEIAAAGRISVSTQERLFRQILGLTPMAYLRRIRLNAACRLLRESDETLSKIAVDCGFNDQPSMTRAFRVELRITPARYRQRFSERSASGARRSATEKLAEAVYL